MYWILNQLMCLVLTHDYEGKVRLIRETGEMEFYYQCNRCGKEFRIG